MSFVLFDKRRKRLAVWAMFESVVAAERAARGLFGGPTTTRGCAPWQKRGRKRNARFQRGDLEIRQMKYLPGWSAQVTGWKDDAFMDAV